MLMSFRRTGVSFLLTLTALLVLMVVGINMMDLSPEQIQTQSLPVSLLPYRLAAYALILAAWTPLSRLLTHPRVPEDERTPELMARWGELAAAVAKGRWKVALFFAVFELVAIQKLEFLL